MNNNCVQCDLCSEIMLRAMRREWLASCEVRRTSGGRPLTVFVCGSTEVGVSDTRNDGGGVG